MHGVFFEEISHAGEGGLYAELIQNRGFEEANLPQGTRLENGFIVPPRTPHYSMPNNGVSDWKMEWPVKSAHPAWTQRANGMAGLQLSITNTRPLNEATPHSLQVTIAKADHLNTADVVNEGFWGIKAVAGNAYNLQFYLRTGDYKGNVTALLQEETGQTLAAAKFTTVSTNNQWKKYSASLKAVAGSQNAKFVLRFDRPGTVWLDFVSLFPAKTYKNRPNGLRQDLAQYIADLKPAFVRWPGGCFVEGINIQSAPDWKRTIGPVEKRPGSYSPWGYWTSDGFGYHEYLQYCEDIGAAALYVFNAGVSCDYRSGTFAPDDSLQPYIQNALDAIEYAIGPVTTKWGKVRAAAGHPKPFPLRYVEVGNEQHGPRYAERYNRFYEAIKTKYPSVQIMASMGIGDVNDYTLNKMKKVDYTDEHAYKAAGWAMMHFDHFDQYKRGNWDMYVGEYATNAGVGAGNMEAALNDAIYIMSMEKNGDLVKMSSYAPLLVNTNDVDWPVNLINFNASQSFARISYYAIKLFNENRPS
ncbi:MAG TPA: alpha-L-arabinofuranosidase C-terminal domain-containing protein, partial [Flavisolibacter sp.]|nr:alpha-L-arabinofuranosidase C-terminal domain-containing protein [Flavisolibacter sp.]